MGDLDLVERLERRAEDDQACAENSMAVFQALGEHYRAFDQRSGRWNTYAVRMALEHKKAAEKDVQHAADLREVVAELRRLRGENARIRSDALEEAAKLADAMDPNASDIGSAIRALKDTAGVDINRLTVGTPVEKVGGYPFPGEVRCGFTTRAGQERFVVEATGPDYAGMLHIFNGGQLRALKAEGESR